jgi:dTDP-glucose pyrophosphorylase
MQIELNHEQRMILIQSVWSNMGEHDSYLTDDRFITEKIEERLAKLKELETILWAGENK